MSIEKLTEFASETDAKNTDGLTLIQGFPSRLKPARQWFNWLFNSLTVKINEIIDANNTSNDTSIGLISICPFSAIPLGYMECNGSILNIIDYPVLFAKLGIIYGGNGITTFKLPDLRGEFVRGLDSGRGVDSGRVMGSQQTDAMQNITGRFSGGLGDRASGAFTRYGDGDGQAGTASLQSVFDFDASRQVRTASENRPRNVAMIYVIKVN